ncbi:MAG: hypothetical protein HC799_16760 [Limnothrix sp. RL_2_0]|nr:hypothetical protein [Limnothrix sp. RL_2_0]
MEDSQLIYAAKQGDPQAIASFLGNHLAELSLWVTATSNHRYLDLYLESLEPPQPQRVLHLIQQLLCNLQPDSVELVKISGRCYGDLQAQWQRSFLLSEVVPLDDFQVNAASAAIVPRTLAPKAVDPSLNLKRDVLISDLGTLVLSVNEAFQAFGVAAKITGYQQILKIELRSLRAPDQENCLTVLYQVLAHLNFPDIRQLQVQAFSTRQVEPAWQENILVQDLLLLKHNVSAAQFVSFRQENEFFRPIGIGLVVGLLVFFVPFFHFAFVGIVTFLADMGQAIAYGAMGYLPTALSNPFQGGGVTVIPDRLPLLIGIFYGAYGLLLFLIRRRLRWLLFMGAIAALLGLLLVTNNATIFISLASHLTIWILSAICLYCALGHYSCRNQGERALYVVFSTFFYLYNLDRYFHNFQADINQLDWLSFVGLGITLFLPFFTYIVFRDKLKRRPSPRSQTVTTLQTSAPL